MDYACLKPFGDRTPAEAISCAADGIGNIIGNIFRIIGQSIAHVIESPGNASINDWEISIASIGIFIFGIVSDINKKK